MPERLRGFTTSVHKTHHLFMPPQTNMRSVASEIPPISLRLNKDIQFYNDVTRWCGVTGARHVYVVSQLVYTVGAAAMALSRHRIAVVLLSVCPGIMYSMLFTMPYLLVAHYHSTNTVYVEHDQWRSQEFDFLFGGGGIRFNWSLQFQNMC